MVLHNRLTHSLKVEQVGLSIYSKLQAETLGLDELADRSAIAAACLAHDLGHPPFGHAGEQELHAMVTCDFHRESPRPLDERRKKPCTVCLLEDGFEGNAQSFRILAVLAVHKDSGQHPEPVGLDLTAATLRAASKYPWARGDNPAKPVKWGAYDCDIQILDDLTGASPKLTLDAQIMDWADDISYAVHDIEDFYRTGHIPLWDYKADREDLKRFLEYALSDSAAGPASEEVLAALNNLLTFFPTSQFTGSQADLAELDAARGILLTQFINGATVVGNNLQIDPIQKQLNAIVKQFIWYHVIDGPRLTNIQSGQRRVLRDIFTAMRGPAERAYRVQASGEPTEKELRSLPYALRTAIDVGMRENTYSSRTKIVHRGLLDYISGLSDADAYHQHAVLQGREPVGHL
jgi:dGTPase